MSTLVCIGQIVNVHGIKGAVKIKPYLNNPLALCTFGPLTDSKGQRIFDLHSCQIHKEGVIASLKGVTDRTAAEALKGTDLYVARSVMPKEEANEFYYCDLIGMTVLENNQPYGTVKSVENYGAGDILEIKTIVGKTMSFSFTETIFPKVDVQAKTIDILLPLDVNGDTDED